MRRVGRLPDIHALAEFLGLAGHFETLASGVVEPAVIAAADAALLDLAPFERRPAMRAMRFERADAPSLVAKDDDLLAEELFLARQILQLLGETDRLPIAAQEFAHRAARLDAGQLVIGWRGLPSVSRFHRLPPYWLCQT